MGPRLCMLLLLTVCGAAPDCAFLVLDTRPEGTYTEQVAECDALTGPLAEDCAGHAAQRFLSFTPSDAELRVAEDAPHGRSLNSMLPDYMLRTGRSSCPDLGSMTAACSAALHALRARGASPAPPAYTPGPPGPRDGR